MTPRFFENAPPTHSVPPALRISPRKGGEGGVLPRRKPAWLETPTNTREPGVGVTPAWARPPSLKGKCGLGFRMLSGEGVERPN